MGRGTSKKCINALSQLNDKRYQRLLNDYPAEKIISLYNEGKTMKEIKSILGCGMVWIRKCLVENNIKLRIKNDYSNPAQDQDFAEKIRRSRRSYIGENNPNYGKTCSQKAIEATKKANTGKVSPRKGKPYPQSIGWVCKDPEHPDKLYFIKLHNGKYKVGRSYKGWLYRKKETAELLGEWSGKSIDIWNLEKEVLKEFSQYKASLTEMSMGRGMTEHFMEDLPVEIVVSFINDKHNPS